MIQTNLAVNDVNKFEIEPEATQEMLLVELYVGGIESYKIDESRLKLFFKQENGVLFYENEHIQIIVSQNENNKGQNLTIQENTMGLLIVDESTEQQRILIDGLFLFGDNPSMKDRCQDMLIFFTLDEQINLHKFQKCGNKFELLLKKEATIKGMPSKMLLDTMNLVLVTDSSLYVFDYDL